MLNTEELHTQRLQHSPLERIHEALEAHDCNSCGATGGFVYDFGDGLNPTVLCQTCTHNTLVGDAAQDQLERLLIPVVRAWALHWGPLVARTGRYASVPGILRQVSENFKQLVSDPALEGLGEEEAKVPARTPTDWTV